MTDLSNMESKRITPTYTDEDGNEYIGLIQTKESCITDDEGIRLDRKIADLQTAVGLGDSNLDKTINDEIDKKVGILNDLETNAKDNVVSAANELQTALQSLNSILSSTGLNNNILINTKWDEIQKTLDLKTTFFTNWTNTTELPRQYGSGIIIPGLDSSNKFIIYTSISNNTVSEAWMGFMKFTDNTTYTINWSKIKSDTYIDVYKKLGDNYIMTATDFDKPGLYNINSLDDVDNNAPDNNTGDYYALCTYGGSVNYKTIILISPRFASKYFYIGHFWAGVWQGWKTVTTNDTVSGINLLINPDFKINQRGLTEYSDANIYTIDRWMIGGEGGTVTLENDFITLTNPTSGETAHLIQQIENGFKIYKGNYITASICMSDGTIYSGTIHIPVNQNYLTLDFINNDSIRVFTQIAPGEAPDLIRILIAGKGTPISFKWVKLELGSVATQFVPPNPAEELVKCKRYFQRLSTNGIHVFHSIGGRNLTNFKFEEEMRTTPSLKAITTDLRMYVPYVETVISASSGEWFKTYSGNTKGIQYLDFDGFSFPVGAEAGCIGYLDNNHDFLELDAEIY